MVNIFKFININIEFWKYNKKYNFYVSNHGHLKDKNGNEIQLNVNQSGYMFIKIDNEPVYIHRLVMETWKPNKRMSTLTIDHIDHNKRNNCVKNLEWVTAKENQKRADRDFEDISTRWHKAETIINIDDTKKDRDDRIYYRVEDEYFTSHQIYLLMRNNVSKPYNDDEEKFKELLHKRVIIKNSFYSVKMQECKIK